MTVQVPNLAITYNMKRDNIILLSMHTNPKPPLFPLSPSIFNSFQSFYSALFGQGSDLMLDLIYLVAAQQITRTQQPQHCAVPIQVTLFFMRLFRNKNQASFFMLLFSNF